MLIGLVSADNPRASSAREQEGIAELQHMHKHEDDRRFLKKTLPTALQNPKQT
jgi:hypothetical protein